MVKETRECFCGEELLVEVTDSSSGERQEAKEDDQSYIPAELGDRKEFFT